MTKLDNNQNGASYLLENCESNHYQVPDDFCAMLFELFNICCFLFISTVIYEGIEDEISTSKYIRIILLD